MTAWRLPSPRYAVVSLLELGISLHFGHAKGRAPLSGGTAGEEVKGSNS